MRFFLTISLPVECRFTPSSVVRLFGFNLSSEFLAENCKENVFIQVTWKILKFRLTFKFRIFDKKIKSKLVPFRLVLGQFFSQSSVTLATLSLTSTHFIDTVFTVQKNLRKRSIGRKFLNEKLYRNNDGDDF